jgi:8-oxo-dGTP pyrophosphatase MutT (NUDIX family)
MISDSLTDEVRDVLMEDLDRLREEWGAFEVIEQHHQIAASAHDPTEEPANGVFRYAAAWIRSDGQVLLVQPSVDEGWAAPVGTHEPGKTFEETARREVREETGVTCRLTGILEATVTIVDPTGFEPINALGVIFTADYVDGEIRPEPGEIDDVRWFSRLPSGEELVLPRIAK